jgi:hypothetical protein
MYIYKCFMPLLWNDYTLRCNVWVIPAERELIILRSAALRRWRHYVLPARQQSCSTTDDDNMNLYCCENLKSHNDLSVSIPDKPRDLMIVGSQLVNNSEQYALQLFHCYSFLLLIIIIIIIIHLLLCFLKLTYCLIVLFFLFLLFLCFYSLYKVDSVVFPLCCCLNWPYGCRLSFCLSVMYLAVSTVCSFCNWPYSCWLGT